jgi:hypothetical protein
MIEQRNRPRRDEGPIQEGYMPLEIEEVGRSAGTVASVKPLTYFRGGRSRVSGKTRRESDGAMNQVPTAPSTAFLDPRLLIGNRPRRDEGPASPLLALRDRLHGQNESNCAPNQTDHPLAKSGVSVGVGA